MRYFCYNAGPFSGVVDELSTRIEVVSEEEIRKEYYPIWKEKILKKYGSERAKDFVFEDCLDDWITINWAWESKD